METNTETPAAVFQGLPLRGLEPTDTIQTGDLCLDRDGGWLPFVGPVGDPVVNWIGDHLRQFARLLPEFIEEGYELCSMHQNILLPCTVLKKVNEVWRWVEPDRLGAMAYLSTDIIAMRRPIMVQQGTPRTPIAEWMSHELQELMRTNITDVLVRGLVRRNHQLIIPMDIFQTGDHDRIVQWLEEERARTHVETVQYVRVYQERRRHREADILRGRAAFGTNEINWTVIGAPPPQAPPVADTVIIEYVARIRRVEIDERFDRIRYAVNVPRTVFDQGEGRVEQYCYEEYREGNYDRIEMVEEGDWDRIEEEAEIRDVQTTNYQEIYETINPPPEEDPFEDAEQEAIDDNNN